jgi:hypothetical protein
VETDQGKINEISEIKNLKIRRCGKRPYSSSSPPELRAERSKSTSTLVSVRGEEGGVPGRLAAAEAKEDDPTIPATGAVV